MCKTHVDVVEALLGYAKDVLTDLGAMEIMELQDEGKFPRHMTPAEIHDTARSLDLLGMHRKAAQHDEMAVAKAVGICSQQEGDSRDDVC